MGRDHVTVRLDQTTDAMTRDDVTNIHSNSIDDAIMLHANGPTRLPINAELLASPIIPPVLPAGAFRVSSLYIMGNMAPDASPIQARNGISHPYDGTIDCKSMPPQMILPAAKSVDRNPCRSPRFPHHGALIMVVSPTMLTTTPESVDNNVRGAPSSSK